LEQDVLDWEMRSFVYAYIVEHGIPPASERAAAEFGLEGGSARASYERLHERHALFLEAESREVRMAFPFSAIPTRFLVRVNDRSYWANCAWDMLGVPAALHSDAEIEAEYAEDGSPAHLSVVNGRLQGDDGVVHFPLPLRHWYDDLVFT
jgi:Alkylmercury lyase